MSKNKQLCKKGELAKLLKFVVCPYFPLSKSDYVKANIIFNFWFVFLVLYLNCPQMTFSGLINADLDVKLCSLNFIGFSRAVLYCLYFERASIYAAFSRNFSN